VGLLYPHAALVWWSAQQNLHWRNRSLANSDKQYCFTSPWTEFWLPTRTKLTPNLWATPHHSDISSVISRFQITNSDLDLSITTTGVRWLIVAHYNRQKSPREIMTDTVAVKAQDHEPNLQESYKELQTLGLTLRLTYELTATWH